MWWPGTIPAGTTVFPDQNNPNAVKVSDNSMHDQVVYFKEGDHQLAANFLVGATKLASPGLPNTFANSEFIEAMKPIVCVGTEFDLGCPGSTDYCYVWASSVAADSLGDGQQDGTITVYPSGPTIYRRTALDGDGNIVGETSYTIRTHATFLVAVTEEQLTAADCIAEAMFRLSTKVSEEYAGYTYSWSSGKPHRS